MDSAQKGTEIPKDLEKPSISKKNKPPKIHQASIKKYLLLTIIVLIAAGYFFYSKAALTGLKRVSESTIPILSEITEPAPATAESVPGSKPPGEQDRCQIKLAEAEALRGELLRKKKEILDLKLYYKSGINELKQVIIDKARRDRIRSYADAIKHKQIELQLRIIQRRLAYIRELDKPLTWVDQASEDLLFLIRKMQIDLTIKDVADGIDFDNQSKHLSVAIQTYRPNAEKLAINLNDTEYQPLTSIWRQIESQIRQETHIAVGAGEDEILNEICSGHFERVADLTTMSVEAAKCLSKMNRSDLFLNQLTNLTPTAAKYLFQWQGNWICLNGLKNLSPSVARYLFQWGGDWISLNGLTEFSPQLATYLLDWRGQQLELMGLESGTDRNALNHLIQWEKSGGKLYVSEEIRKEMRDVI